MKEQRRYERVPFFCPVRLAVLPNGPAVPGRSFDISIGGVGVVTDLVLERGQPVCVRFHLHNGVSEEVEEDVMGRVTGFQADEDGGRTGIEFLETIQESTQPALTRKINEL
jgi:hypothetical protein